jgi:outer membrane protein OmpA-like peptidoglycan-associated protein
MIRFFALAGVFLILVSKPAAFAHTDQLSEQYDNYVVIGAFAIKQNAINFTDEAYKEKLHAKYDLNRSRNLFYVYVLNTDDLQQAIDAANAIRQRGKYADTWVYKGGFDQLPESASLGVDLHPASEEKILNVVPKDSNGEVASVNNEITSGDDVAEEITAVVSPVLQDNTKKTSSTGTATGKQEGKSFLFRILRADDNRDITADVDMIDVDRSKKIASYKGNAPVWVNTPTNKSGDVSVVCNLFGYRKAARTFNFQNPTGDGIDADRDGNVVVPFELVRLQKGDIAVMYNVYFFKDAGVMRPESRFEVNSLLEMLQENPDYKIKIHGHTNGGAHGKIISMTGDNNFFSLTGTRDGFGSAKKLSFERAKVIEAYLVSKGIMSERMAIKAWGGKRPIHDKHHTRAAENVRVEIEIVSD